MLSRPEGVTGRVPSSPNIRLIQATCSDTVRFITPGSADAISH